MTKKITSDSSEAAATNPEVLALAVAPLSYMGRPVFPDTIHFLPDSPLPNGRPIESSTLEFAHYSVDGDPVFKDRVQFTGQSIMQRPVAVSLVKVPTSSPLPNNRPIADNHTADDEREYDWLL